VMEAGFGAAKNSQRKIPKRRDRRGGAVARRRRELWATECADVACGEDSGKRSAHIDIDLDVAGAIERQHATQEGCIRLESDIDKTP
jgi:hypothetical protein